MQKVPPLVNTKRIIQFHNVNTPRTGLKNHHWSLLKKIAMDENDHKELCKTMRNKMIKSEKILSARKV